MLSPAVAAATYRMFAPLTRLVLLNLGGPLFDPFGAGWINDLPDGPVDQNELDAVLLNWGSSVDDLGAAGVPEPATWVMLSLGAAVGLCVRRTSREPPTPLATVGSLAILPETC